MLISIPASPGGGATSETAPTTAGQQVVVDDNVLLQTVVAHDEGASPERNWILATSLAVQRDAEREMYTLFISGHGVTCPMHWVRTSAQGFHANAFSGISGS